MFKINNNIRLIDLVNARPDKNWDYHALAKNPNIPFK